MIQDEDQIDTCMTMSDGFKFQNIPLWIAGAYNDTVHVLFTGCWENLRIYL